MTNLQDSLTFAKHQLSKEYVYIMVKPEILKSLVDEIERGQEYVQEVEDAVQYAMNQIQIKSDYIRRLESEIEGLKDELLIWSVSNLSKEESA